MDLVDVEMAIESGFNCNSAEMKKTPMTAVNSVIWNRGNSKEKKHFLSEPEGFNPSILSRYQLEQLRLFKAWCALCHNEYTKNLLCVLEEMSRQIYGPVHQFPTDFLSYLHWIIRKSSRSLHVDPKTKLDLYRTFLRRV